MAEHHQQFGQENKKKRKKWLFGCLIFLCLSPFIILTNFYLDSKYRKREFNLSKYRYSIEFTDQKLDLEGTCFSFYYQGYDVVYSEDSVFLTIYVTQIPQKQDSSDDVYVHLEGDFSKYRKVYFCYKGTKTLVYEK